MVDALMSDGPKPCECADWNAKSDPARQAGLRMLPCGQNHATGRSSPTDCISCWRCACSSGVGARQRR